MPHAQHSTLDEPFWLRVGNASRSLSTVLCMCAGELRGCPGWRPPSPGRCTLRILLVCLASRASFVRALCHEIRAKPAARIQAPQSVKSDLVSFVHHALNTVLNTQSEMSQIKSCI